MAGLSEVSFYSQPFQGNSRQFDECIGAMLFDYSQRAHFFHDIPIIDKFFGKGQMQVIYSIEDAEYMGLLDDDVMNGVVAYHIRTFYEFVEGEKELYVMFADCGSGFDVIQEMQTQAGGKLFYIGIWTEQCIFDKRRDGSYIFNDIISDINYNIKELSNINGAVSNVSSMVSALLFANVSQLSNGEPVDYRKLPNMISLDCPKLSVILGQEGSDEVHGIQNKNVNNTPVGLLGFAMGCLATITAENSIGNVGQLNLNKHDTLKNPELGFGDDYTPITGNNGLLRIRRDTLIEKGFIVLTDYAAKAGEVFFSNDQTLSAGSYNTISKNRLIHKVGRIIRFTMLEYVNSSISIDAASGLLHQSAIVEISTKLYRNIDSFMKTRKKEEQLKERTIYISQDQDILSDDSLRIKASFVPVATNERIDVEQPVKMQ